MATEHKFFPGVRYNFKVYATPHGSHQGAFSIYAICKQSGRRSCVTTVNGVLNYLIPSVCDYHNDSRLFESDWRVTKREMKQFVKRITKALKNKKCLADIEDHLDEDRNEGEWENIES